MKLDLTPDDLILLEDLAAALHLTIDEVRVPTMLTSGPRNVRSAGLNLNLGPGTFFLGIRTDVTGPLFASIGSGPGGPDTLGPGLFQAFGTSPASGGNTRSQDHFAFQLLSGQAVPEPTTLLLLGLGLAGLGFARKRLH